MPTTFNKGTRPISLIRLLAPHWKSLLIGLVSAFGSVLADILQPVPIKLVIDNVLGGKPIRYWAAAWMASPFGTGSTAMLNLAVAAVVVIALLNALSSYAQNLSMTTIGQWVMHDLRATLYHQIQRLSLAYHDRSRTGDLISRVTNDIDTVQSFVASVLMDTIIDALTLVTMISIMIGCTTLPTLMPQK